MPENLLAIDNGTQSVRALLFDPRTLAAGDADVVVAALSHTLATLRSQQH